MKSYINMLTMQKSNKTLHIIYIRTTISSTFRIMTVLKNICAVLQKVLLSDIYMIQMSLSLQNLLKPVFSPKLPSKNYLTQQTKKIGLRLQHIFLNSSVKRNSLSHLNSNFLSSGFPELFSYFSLDFCKRKTAGFLRFSCVAFLFFQFSFFRFYRLTFQEFS